MITKTMALLVFLIFIVIDGISLAQVRPVIICDDFSEDTNVELKKSKEDPGEGPTQRRVDFSSNKYQLSQRWAIVSLSTYIGDGKKDTSPPYAFMNRPIYDVEKIDSVIAIDSINKKALQTQIRNHIDDKQFAFAYHFPIDENRVGLVIEQLPDENSPDEDLLIESVWVWDLKSNEATRQDDAPLDLDLAELYFALNNDRYTVSRISDDPPVTQQYSFRITDKNTGACVLAAKSDSRFQLLPSKSKSQFIYSSDLDAWCINLQSGEVVWHIDFGKATVDRGRIVEVDFFRDQLLQSKQEGLSVVLCADDDGKLIYHIAFVNLLTGEFELRYTYPDEVRPITYPLYVSPSQKWALFEAGSDYQIVNLKAGELTTIQISVDRHLVGLKDDSSIIYVESGSIWSKSIDAWAKRNSEDERIYKVFSKN
jgi:hypothetical protein